MPLRARKNFSPSSLAPPGTIINHVNPISIGQKIVISNPLLATLAFIFVCLRLFVRWRVVKVLGWEDGFIVIALAFAIARVVVEVLNVKRYTLGVHIWDLTLEDVFRVGDHLKNYIFIGDMLYFFGIMFTKLSILMLYLRIFQPNKKFRYFTYVMITFNVVYLLLFFLLYAFECNPPALGWHTVTWTGGGTCIDTIKVSYAVGGINVFSDLVILVMPLPLLLKLNLKKSQKLGLLAIFATGTFTVACTIVRQVVIMKTLRDFDHGFSTVEEIVWLTVELCVGIICACLPTLAPLYHLQLWARLVPQSVRIYLLSLRTATHGSTTYGSSKMSAKPSGGQSYESDVELVDNGKVSTHVGTHMPTMELVHTDPRRIYRMTDMEVSYSKHWDASNHV